MPGWKAEEGSDTVLIAENSTVECIIPHRTHKGGRVYVGDFGKVVSKSDYHVDIQWHYGPRMTYKINDKKFKELDIYA